jgi:preprotein translocase subunit SecG
MTTVLLVLQLMIAAALIGVVLLQRSEGGALGMGGGGAGGFLTGRGTANLLTRTTALLGAAFFANSMLLTILASHQGGAPSVFDTPPAAEAPAKPGAAATPAGDAGKPAEAPRGGILDKLQKEGK